MAPKFNFDVDRVTEQLDRILQMELAGIIYYTHYSFMIYGHARIPITSWLRDNATESLAHAQRLTENELSDFRPLWHDDCVKQSSRHKMWTEITRRKYERGGQRYASDLTDGEWALIEPQPPSLWAGRGRSSCERCWTRSCISRGPAVSGGCWRRTFRRSQACRAISTSGETTACLRRSILRCCCKRARPRVAKRAQRPGSSTVNRSRRPRAAGRVVMMRPRRSRAASDTL